MRVSSTQFENLDVKILVSNRISLNSRNIANSVYLPVRCGAVFDKTSLGAMVGDSLGENISNRGPTWNEFTVLYWAWKNLRYDYIGLCHYRRYMIFPEVSLESDKYGNVLFDKMTPEVISECGLTDPSHIKEIVSRYDILVSEPFDVRIGGFSNLYEHYAEVPWQRPQDMYMMLEIISEVCPEYLESTESYFNSYLFYPCNLFILKKEIADQYCNWIFQLLLALESRIDLNDYEERGKRVVGYIGERLFGAFLTQYIKNNPTSKWKHTQRAFFLNTSIDEQQVSRVFSPQKQGLKTWVKQNVPESSFMYKTLKAFYKRIAG